MNTLAKLHLGVAMLAISASTLAQNTTPPLNHYDPAALNEHALQYLREGKYATAMLLLERAALLAPEKPEILRNLEILRGAGNVGAPASTLQAETGSAANDETLRQPRQLKPDEDSLPPFPIWKKAATP